MGHRNLLHSAARHLPGSGSGNAGAVAGGFFDDEL